YIGKNDNIFKETLGEGKPDILIRVPVEALALVGKENVSDLLGAFQKAPNAFVELFSMSGAGEVPESAYDEYGLSHKALPNSLKDPSARTRENTVTIFTADKGEEFNEIFIDTKLNGIKHSAKKMNSILIPIGLDRDMAGLVRGMIVGLKMLKIARSAASMVTENKVRDIYALRDSQDQKMKQKYAELLDDAQNVLESYKEVMDKGVILDYHTAGRMNDIEDFLAIAAGDMGKLVRAINKLIKLLPVTPLSAEEIRTVFTLAKKALTAA
ncbi:MAG: hypothetical protein HQL28_01400, partial [Candidatus Omnitrophica bacterium]|nr:hypothetical protein [Candidatus Omnitrophota bacterium]